MLSDITVFLKMISQGALEEGQMLPDSLGDTLKPLMNFMTQLNTGSKVFGLIVSLILSLLCCFFGYKFSRAFMSITGFLAGCLIGYFVGTQLLNGSFPIVPICVLAGGILLALLSFWIYMAGIFIMCFFLAFMAISTLLQFTGDFAFFLYTLLSLGVASLALKFIRPVIILMSSIVGGSSAAGIILVLDRYLHFGVFDNLPPKVIMAAVFCVLGIIVQFLTTREPLKRSKPKHNK